MRISEIIEKIEPVDESAREECRKRFDKVAKPVGSLGALEELIARIAAARGSAEIEGLKKAVVVFCADNGVVAQGVTQTGSEVTAEIARMMVRGKASVTTMAKRCGADVYPVDIGMLERVEGLDEKKLQCGTCDITKGAAMTRETAEEAVLIGVEYVKRLKRKGYTVIGTGEAGIGNTTTSSAVTAALLNKTAKEVTGRGAGLDREGLERKREAVERALKVNQPQGEDALGIVAKVGGLDIAGMMGLYIGGAYYRVPIVMDGFISAAAALSAVRLCGYVREYILPSHVSAEPGVMSLMEELGFEPIIRGGMRLGEGTGAVTLFPLLDMALDVYNHAAKFTETGVEQYEHLS